MSKKFQPMLAEDAEDINALQYPVIASPKLDGIRCVIRDGVALSRSLKPIRNKTVQAWAAEHWEFLERLDGELVAGEHDEGVFQRSQSTIMSAKGGGQWAFWCFDLDDTLPYLERIRQIKTGVNLVGAPPKFKLVPMKRCRTPEELRAFEEECLNRGFEGVMIRKPDGPYKYGRSTLKEGYLLKLKRFTDAEATIIGWDELMSNQNEEKRDARGKINRSRNRDGLVPAGVLGALHVRGPDGTHFKVGSGFTAAQRAELWKMKNKLMNRIIKFKWQEAGTKDKPRCPIFLGFRDPEDV